LSLRAVTIIAFLVLLLFPAALLVTAQTPSSPPKLVGVNEKLPWYSQSGTNFTYKIGGSFPVLNGTQTYTGKASVSVFGLLPNSSVAIKTYSSATNLLFPNGSLSDDPIFPSYIQVLPVSFMVPKSFTVLAPAYGLDFTYLGNKTVEYQGAPTLTYTYSVSAVSAGQQGASSIVKYYEVMPSNGLVLAAGVSNAVTSSTFNMTLSGLAMPTNSNVSDFSFKAPNFAAPGNYITFKSIGVENETIRLQSLASEPNGLFIYEKSTEANGSALGYQFFIDEATSPFFYPASTNFQDEIHFPVAVGTLEDGDLLLQGQTSVKTLDGQFNTYSYANQTIRFEAYLDATTGVAVYVELPGGFLELSSSNFLTPVTPANQVTWLPDLIPIGFVAVLVLLVYFHFRKEPSKPRRR
jgi:hypothetical protein